MKTPKAMPVMDKKEDNILLFHPSMPESVNGPLTETVNSRWIGEGPKVRAFEKAFSEKFGAENAVAVNSGTAALHLAYELIGIGAGDEVIVPLFTCTATNIPLLHLGAKPIFVDVKRDSLNMDESLMEAKITEKTKAIVVVHYGGLPVDMEIVSSIAKRYQLPIVQDNAHALGAEYKGISINAMADYSMYSFQAIKTITTGDGGMLVIHSSDSKKYEEAVRRRWFGIDRSQKQLGVWENDIKEVGHKFQMNDIAASIGLEQLKVVDAYLEKRRALLMCYEKNLSGIEGLQNISGDVDSPIYKHGAWLCTVLVKNRAELQKRLYERQIETNQVHYRNDRYEIFRPYLNQNERYVNMDRIDDEYLVLPLHTELSSADVEFVCSVIREGW